MNHAGQHRFKILATLDKPLEPMLKHLTVLPRRWRQNFQAGGRDDLTCRVGAIAIEHNDPLIRPLLPHDESRRHHLADR